MPSRAGAPFLLITSQIHSLEHQIVSMPSRAEAPFLQTSHRFYQCRKTGYQCPFGLGLHFYFRKQFILWGTVILICINALSGWGSISTVPLQKPRFYAVSGACFCRYLSEYSDNDHFSCMLTIWTYLIVTSTTWIFFSITLFLQFVIRYFCISPISNSLIPNTKVFL